MPTAGTAGTDPAEAPPAAVDGDVETPRMVVVYDCSRLGLTANPPGFSFRDMFRVGRRRR